MKKRVATHLQVVAAAIAALALTAGVAAASSAAPASAGAVKVRTVTIPMHEPGCHAFFVGGKYLTRLVVHGKTAFRNLDEAALVFTGSHFRRRVAVGKTLVIAKRGVYKIKMVGQEPEDNTLTLIYR